MIKVEGKTAGALVSAGIAISFAMLLAIIAQTIFPFPAYPENYQDFFTKESCEQANGTWVTDETGEYCITTELEQYYASIEASNLLLGLLIVIISLIAIIASLFIIKNKIIANGLFAGGIITTLFSVIVTYNILIQIAAIIIVLVALIFLATQKTKAK